MATGLRLTHNASLSTGNPIMNRYPLWTYVVVACALVLGFTYTLPNFFGEAPAVQVSSVKATVKVDSALLARVEDALKAANIVSQGTFVDPNSVKVRLADTDTQLKAKDILSQSLNPDRDNPSYVVALNLLSSSPTWPRSFSPQQYAVPADVRPQIW